MPAARRKPPHGRSSSARASPSASATAACGSRSPPRRSTLLEPETPGPALVDAYAQLASAHAIGGAYAEAIAAADRARALAETLGLPEPARALGYRGYARVWLGDADGLAEMERALALLVERGAGRDAAILQNNLAIARYPLQGPARALADFEEGIAFCEQRGLAEPAAVLEANCPRLLAELGRPERGARARRPARRRRRGERRHVLADRAARGRAREPPRPRRARQRAARPTG